MNNSPSWNPLQDWQKADIAWNKVDISKADLMLFMKRSDIRGLAQAIGFLMVFVATGGLAWMAMAHRLWIWMAVALYFHGTFFTHFGDAIHELSHRTVFKSKWLNDFFTILYGLIAWSWNPHFYRISHTGYHHRYTLYQKSDGENVPNYVELTPKFMLSLFFDVIHPIHFARSLGRLLTLKPTSMGWRGHRLELDEWEQFILREASKADLNKVQRFTVLSLVFQVLFITTCIATNLWFLLVLTFLAPLYGARWHGFYCSVHQHTGCEPNHPDFRMSCADAILDPFSSLLYWHMEYHIEHHMFASIPCYNLKAFSKFIASQLPPKEHSLPRILRLNNICREKYGSWKYWYDNFGYFQGS